MKKQLMVATAVAALAAAVAVPAAATPPKDDDGEHKQNVCHRTLSSNPDKAYVVVWVDYATWSKDGLPDEGNGHQRRHNKDRDRDGGEHNDGLYGGPVNENNGKAMYKHLTEEQAAEWCPGDDGGPDPL